MPKLRWGVLSTAKIGQEQVIPAIQRSSNGEVVAIASRKLEKAQEVADKWAIPKAYDSYDALLKDEQIDAVYIPLPNSMHRQWMIEAANFKKHVLCEKPVALNNGELLEMIETAKQNKITFMEAFMYQFHPQHQKVKKLISNGEIGEIVMMRASFSFYLDNDQNIRLQNHLGGGAMYDVGCYTLHAIRNILSDEPISVYASSTKKGESQVDTTMTGVLTFHDGKLGVFDTSFDTINRQSYEVVGSKGTITVTTAFRPDENENMAGELVLKKEGQTPVTHKEAGDQYKLMVENFASYVLEQKPLAYNVEEMKKQMAILDAVYQSSRENKVIKL